MFEGTAENIASVLAMIVGVALALSTALGALVTYLVEAIKATGLVKDGYSGLVAIAVGMLLGMGLTSLTDLMAAEPYSIGVMILLGAFVGAIVGAGGISQYKASGSVNTGPERTDLATMADLDRVAQAAFEAKGFVDEVKVQAQAEAERMRTELAKHDTQETAMVQRRAPAPR